MRYKTQNDLVTSMREFADFLEARGLELPEPGYGDATIEISWWLPNKEELARTARALGKCEKKLDEYSYNLVRKFGNVKFEAWSSRNVVCTRKQVGTKTVEVTVSVVTGTKEEPVYEWECDPLLVVDSDAAGN